MRWEFEYAGKEWIAITDGEEVTAITTDGHRMPLVRPRMQNCTVSSIIDIVEMGGVPCYVYGSPDGRIAIKPALSSLDDSVYDRIGTAGAWGDYIIARCPRCGHRLYPSAKGVPRGLTVTAECPGCGETSEHRNV